MELLAKTAVIFGTDVPELGCAQLNQALSSFASGLEELLELLPESGGRLSGIDPARYPRAVVEVCACGWQLKRQSTNSKDYGI